MMVTRALVFLIETIGGFFTVMLLLRFLLQWARAAHRNPVADFVNAFTGFIVHPARRVIPGLWGLDLATLLLAWLTQVIEIVLVLLVIGDPARGFGGPIFAGVALIALVNVVRLLLYIIIVIVILQAVLSWINPYSPMAPMLNTVTRPFLRPLQRVIPPVANVDLSPLVVIIICQLILIALSAVA